MAACQQLWLVILKLLAKADRGSCVACLNAATLHVDGKFLSWKLLHEDLFCLFIANKLIDLLSKVWSLKLFTHLYAQSQTLFEMQLVHVVEHFLFLIVEDAQADCIQDFLVHCAL